MQWRLFVLGLVFWLALPGPLAAAPLDEALVTALDGVRADPRPESTTRGKHYWVSNEWQLETFRSDIEGLGGVFVGVGTDQNYIMAAWAKPDVLVLMDFDQAIADLHLAYEVAFLTAQTPEDFVAFWEYKERKNSRRAIRQHFSSRRDRRRAVRAFNQARYIVHTRFEKLLAKSDAKTILNDPEQYATVVQLFKEDRVVAVRGDLTARRTMRDLAEVFDEHGLVVRALYTSNAEQYFNYTRAFKRNITELPTDPRSLLLRTRPTGHDYTYVVQSYDDFEKWLDVKGVRNVKKLAPRSKLDAEVPLYRVPPAPRASGEMARGR